MYEQLLKWSSCRRFIRKCSWIQCWCFNVTCRNKMWDSHVMFLHYISVRRVTVSWQLHTCRLLNVFIFSAATFKPQWLFQSHASCTRPFIWLDFNYLIYSPLQIDFLDTPNFSISARQKKWIAIVFWIRQMDTYCSPIICNIFRISVVGFSLVYQWLCKLMVACHYLLGKQMGPLANTWNEKLPAVAFPLATGVSGR